MRVVALAGTLPVVAMIGVANAPSSASASTLASSEPSAVVTGDAACTADGTYSITWTVHTSGIPDGDEAEVKVITPENAWLYEWAQHSANHGLPALPPNASFTWVQTGVAGSTTTAHVTFQIDWHSYSHDPEGVLTLTGDCTAPPPPPTDVLPETTTSSVDDTSCSTGFVTTTTTTTTYSWMPSNTSRPVAIPTTTTSTSSRAATAVECPLPPVDPPVPPLPPVDPPVPPITPDPPTTPVAPATTTATTPASTSTTAHTGIASASPARKQLASTGVDARLVGVTALVLLTAGIMAVSVAVIRRRGPQ
ncbi:hypothetical protein [Agreia bicolorata]|uniref:Uncharacterized protein n=1 Tax=Agreia bicolorata TaxID=110935 RepID=A0ABR5CDM1_9MICO|nr:hypothetical protein [Agreia bicolorata]KJC63692.1 hypothetical protein TZ00_14450 [Agreia bicolorata]